MIWSKLSAQTRPQRLSPYKRGHDAVTSRRSLRSLVRGLDRASSMTIRIESHAPCLHYERDFLRIFISKRAARQAEACQRPGKTSQRSRKFGKPVDTVQFEYCQSQTRASCKILASQVRLEYSTNFSLITSARAFSSFVAFL